MIYRWVHFIITASLLSGCTGATPEVSSLASNFRFFSIDREEVRLQSPTDLNSVTITASCVLNQTEFWYELPDLSIPTGWTLVPTTLPSAPFVSVSNNCSTTKTVDFVLDLSSYAEFANLLSNSSLRQKVNFRDTNITGFSQIEEILFYSSSKAPTERFILGQGINNPINSGGYSLRGRITSLGVNTQHNSGAYTLRGRVVVNQ